MKTVRSDEAFEALVSETLASKRVLALDYETRPVSPYVGDRRHIVGFGLAWWEDDTIPIADRQKVLSAYVPLHHVTRQAKILSDEEFEETLLEGQVSVDVVSQLLSPLLHDSAKTVVMHNAKFDSAWSEVLTDTPQGDNIICTMHWAKMVDENNSMGLKECARRYLRRRAQTLEDVTGLKSDQIDCGLVEIDKLAKYCAADAENSLLLTKILGPEIEKQQLWRPWHDLWRPLIRVTRKMEQRGAAVDIEYAHRLIDQADRLASATEQRAWEMAGHEFNLGSSKQLSQVLFVKMGLPVLKSSAKTGEPSTAQDVLEKLGREHLFPRVVVNYRRLRNTSSKEVKSLLATVDPMGRVHANFVKFPVTGRFACRDPNLQNVKRNDTATYHFPADFRDVIDEDFLVSEEDHVKMFGGPCPEDEVAACLSVRRMFRAPEGYKIILADYNQLELRLMAHFSGDPLLMQAYSEGLDIHQQTADLVGCTRAQAKAVNFGLIYGMSWQTLAEQIGVPWAEGKRLHTNFFDSYRGVKRYHRDVISYAKAHEGAVRTICGRRRRCEDVFLETTSSTFRVVMDAERELINATIQGTAADLLDLASIRIDDSKIPLYPMLQIHDELNSLVPEDRAEDMARLQEQIMTEAFRWDCERLCVDTSKPFPFRVPIVVEAKVGDHWGEK